MNFFFFFFFQAEDGIRDRDVTGVQDVCSSDLPGVLYLYINNLQWNPQSPFDIIFLFCFAVSHALSSLALSYSVFSLAFFSRNKLKVQKDLVL